MGVYKTGDNEVHEHAILEDTVGQSNGGYNTLSASKVDGA